MKTRIHRLLAVSMALMTAGALAQHRHTSEPDTQDHDGTWSVRIEDGKGNRWTGSVEVRDFGGTWKLAPAKGPRDARCDGRPTPITVQGSHAEDLDFTVWGSSVAPQCPDLTLEMTLRGDGKLEAVLADGRRVELTRRPPRRTAQRPAK